MSEKLRFRATMTVEVEYEVDIDMDSFGADDIQTIIRMEQMCFDQDPADLLGRDEAQHWVDVENITGATTDQQVDDDEFWPGSGFTPVQGVKGHAGSRATKYTDLFNKHNIPQNARESLARFIETSEITPDFTAELNRNTTYQAFVEDVFVEDTFCQRFARLMRVALDELGREKQETETAPQPISKSITESGLPPLGFNIKGITTGRMTGKADLTGATTDQQVDDDTWPAGSRGVEPPLGFNVEKTRAALAAKYPDLFDKHGIPKDAQAMQELCRLLLDSTSKGPLTGGTLADTMK